MRAAVHKRKWNHESRPLAGANRIQRCCCGTVIHSHSFKIRLALSLRLPLQEFCVLKPPALQPLGGKHLGGYIQAEKRDDIGPIPDDPRDDASQLPVRGRLHLAGPWLAKRH